MDTPKENLRHHPTPMARFGQNPYGDNLYRIVFAPSRRYLVYGEWPNGERKATWLPKYPEVGDSWVMERWLTPFEYARCAPEEWNRELTVLGPYPDRGEYEICHKFNLVTPDQESITKLVELIEASHKNTRRNGNVFDNPENTVACHELENQRQQDVSKEVHARLENLFPAYGGVPMSGYGGARGTKTFPLELSAQDLRMPTMRPPAKRGEAISRHSFKSVANSVIQP